MNGELSHVVYTIRDKSNRALYVGMTRHLPARIADHCRKTWYPARPVIEQTEPLTYTDAFFMERRLIWFLQPLHNRTLERGIYNTDGTVPERTAMVMIGQPNSMSWRHQIFAGFGVTPVLSTPYCDSYAFNDVEMVARALGVAAAQPRTRGKAVAA